MGEGIELDNLIEIKDVKSVEKSGHTSSKLQPDTLFHFMEKVEWLIEILESKSMPARYCQEDIRYLELQGIECVAIPMRCFCDIRLHDLQEHVQYYGSCGIAFPKQWGMNNGIQPIHYINPNSMLRKDFSEAFNETIKNQAKRESKVQKKLKNFALHQMMYYKPYSGKSRNRITKKEDEKCFTDECEWRYIANVTPLNYDPLIICDGVNSDYINRLTESLKKYKHVALNFEYKDIKYLIVETYEDFVKLSSAIENLGISSTEKLKLISKIIIWDDSKGDF